MIKAGGLQLRESKKPQEAHMVDDPTYCVFHRCLGHTLEDCFVFKDLVEKKYQTGEISLSKKFLLPEASVHMISIAGVTLESEGRWKASPSWNTRENLSATGTESGYESSENLSWEDFMNLINVNHERKEKTKEISAHICMISTSKANTPHQVDDQSDCQRWWALVQEKQNEIERLKDHSREREKFTCMILAENAQLKREINKLKKANDTIEQAKATSNKSKLQERCKKQYSFKKEAVKPLFNSMMKEGLVLPKPKKTGEIDTTGSSAYCPYHRQVGHVIMNCFVFKDLLEQKYQEKTLFIAEKYLLPKENSTNAQLTERPPKGMDFGIYIGDPESSDEEPAIKELASITKSSKLLEKMKIQGGDDGASSSQKPTHQN